MNTSNAVRHWICLVSSTRSLKERVSSKLRIMALQRQDLNAYRLSKRSGSTCIKPSCGRRVVTYSLNKRDILASIYQAIQMEYGEILQENL